MHYSGLLLFWCFTVTLLVCLTNKAYGSSSGDIGKFEYLADPVVNESKQPGIFAKYIHKNTNSNKELHDQYKDCDAESAAYSLGDSCMATSSSTQVGAGVSVGVILVIIGVGLAGLRYLIKLCKYFAAESAQAQGRSTANASKDINYPNINEIQNSTNIVTDGGIGYGLTAVVDNPPPYSVQDILPSPQMPDSQELKEKKTPDAGDQYNMVPSPEGEKTDSKGVNVAVMCPTEPEVTPSVPSLSTLDHPDT